MARIVVERVFARPQDLRAQIGIEECEPCLELYRVRWIRSYWSLDRRRVIAIFDAPDAESLRALQRQAALAFERVWSAELCEVGEDEA